MYVSEFATRSLQSLVDATRTAIKSLITPVHNIEGHGAVEGGTTENTTAIQAAIDAANGRAPVFIPYGTFLTGPLTTPANTHFIGYGTLKLKAAAAGHLISPAGKLTIEGITLDGNKANQTMAAGDGPDLIYSTHQVVASGVTFKDGQRYGLYTVGGDDTLISRCYGTGMANIVWYIKNADRPKVYKNYTDNTCTGHAIALYDLCCDGVVIGNTVQTNAANKFGIELWTNTGAYPKGCVISGNTVNGNNTGGGISMSGAHECLCHGNRVRDCISIASIELAQGATGCVVEGNVVENSYRIAVTGATGARLSRCIVRNNRVKNPIKNGSAGGQGMYVFKADDCTIEGNEITGAAGHTVELSDAQRNIFRHNRIQGGALSGFYVGNANENLFELNHISDHTTAGRYAFQLALASETPLNVIRNNTGDNNAAWISSYTDTIVVDNASEYSVAMAGSVTLTAGALTQVSNSNVTSKSLIFLTPTNAAAAALVGGATGVYVAEKASGSYFNIRHGAAAGTETFNYAIH